MLQNCIDIFRENPDIDKMIFDVYAPADGTYVFMEETVDGFSLKKLIEVKFDKKSKEYNITEEEKSKISYYDYNSGLLEMNKPIDPKKTIQSNNYLSFWIKKESLTNGKLTEEKIDSYYEILSNPYIKYTKSKDKELYTLVEQKVGIVNQKKLKKIKKWIKNNIFNLSFEVTGKDYLKIFFICEEVDFEKEGKRYVIPNIFNKNEYNIKVGEDILGLPNENLGLNSKKPFLENKSRKMSVPTLINTKEIMIRKKFFDYLWNLVSAGKYNIYFDNKDNKIYTYDYKTPHDSDFKGYFLRLKKEKNEAAILDMDIITSYSPDLRRPIFIDNIIGLDEKKLKNYTYGIVSNLNILGAIVNDVFFSKYLYNNFFTEADKISTNDTILKESILVARNVLSNWFYKGYEHGVDNVMDFVSLNLIKNSIVKNNLDVAQHQFNLRTAFLEYFKGDDIKMADVMKKIRDNLREKINSKEYESILSDKEYYYAVGQIIRYFISLNKGSKKNHSLFNPFLNIKNNKSLKGKIETFFRKYNYTISENSLRFNQLYNLIISYKPETDIDHDYMIAGYISKNLLYEKRED